MATYIGIKGVEIQTIAGDPANPLAGQVWYNTTANTMKAYGKQGTGAWAAATSIPVGLEYCGLAGIQTAAVLWGGASVPPYSSPIYQSTTFEYDGTSWTEVNAVVQACVNTGGVGTQTAAAAFGTDGPSYAGLCIEYDGTSWTAGNSRPFDSGASANFGTQTAGVSATGYMPGATPSGNLDDVAHYDGTSWTVAGNFPAPSSASSAAGTQTAGILMGGYQPPTIIASATQTYDGTTWTAVPSMGTARYSSTNGGSQTATIIAGGTTTGQSAVANTEIYNGSAWTEVGNLGTAATFQAKGFSMTAAATLAFISAGGSNRPPGFVATVEEFTVPDATKTFTSS